MENKKFRKVYPREKYLSKIRPFYHSDVIKVITGIRRCGKSYVLKAIINELMESDIDAADIIYIPLDKRGYKSIKTPKQLEDRIEEEIAEKDFYYLIIDEVQNVKGFEEVVHAYQEEGYSVFLTGSNSYLLSDEISTKLTGRYIPFEIFPLDFMEYMDMKRFFNLNVNSDLYGEMDEYIINGGFPKALEFPELSARRLYTSEIIKEIFVKDVRKRKEIRNVMAYERVQAFVINNFSSIISVSNIVEELEKNNIKIKAATVRQYINYLNKAKIIYECNRFDLKSKKSLNREQKYYLADLSLYYAVNTDNRLNYGPSLENLVYLYFISNGYKVSVGKIGKLECDFIVRNDNNDYAYVQVTYSLQKETAVETEKIKEREYRPFRNIKDGYPRYIISLDRFRDQQEGVHHISAIDLFTGKVKI